MSHSLDKYIEIKSDRDLNAFLELVGEFHDSIIKEIHSFNSGYVDSDLAMCFGGFDLRVLIQRQYKDISAVELLLGNVSEYHIIDSGDIYSASGSIEFNEITGKKKIIIDFDGNKFICDKLFWKDASECMGIKSIFGEELKIDLLQEYEELEDGWVICQKCFEAWRPSKSIVQCPKCLLNNGFCKY